MAKKDKTSSGIIQEFLKLESAGGILLMGAAVVAMILANSPLDKFYSAILELPLQVRIGAIDIAKPLILWINDGLMAVFFLMIGLEVKREILEGELSTPAQVVLPGVAAVGGMLFPALVYVWFNHGDPYVLKGWAIPTATDIAFSLGILSLLGKRVPLTLKIFLTALAIVDDLGAILIIAIFYTADLSMLALIMGGICIAAMVIMNYAGVTRIAGFSLLGIIMWVCVLKSGVHATLAGVAMAFTIPLRAVDEDGHSPAKHLEHTLHPWVSYAILPIFAFANAGVPLAGISFDALLQPEAMGVIAGLFLGKQVGVFGLSWLAIKLKFAKMLEGANMMQIYGTSVLTGIGFTMSLFIATLAFDDPSAAELLKINRLAILIASILSAAWGYIVLRISFGKEEKA